MTVRGMAEGRRVTMPAEVLNADRARTIVGRARSSAGRVPLTTGGRVRSFADLPPRETAARRRRAATAVTVVPAARAATTAEAVRHSATAMTAADRRANRGRSRWKAGPPRWCRSRVRWSPSPGKSKPRAARFLFSMSAGSSCKAASATSSASRAAVPRRRRNQRTDSRRRRRLPRRADRRKFSAAPPTARSGSHAMKPCATCCTRPPLRNTTARKPWSRKLRRAVGTRWRCADFPARCSGRRITTTTSATWSVCTESGFPTCRSTATSRASAWRRTKLF